MLAIVLWILKVIGLLFLGILSLLLILLLSVLLIPIRYRAEGATQETWSGEASVSWMLRMLSCQVKYDGKLDTSIRLCGIRLGRKRKAARKLRNEDREAETSEQTAEAEVPEQTEMLKTKKTTESTGRRMAAETLKDHRDASEPRRLDKTPWFCNPFRKWCIILQRICDKLIIWKHKKEKLWEFINQEENRRTFRLLKKQIWIIAKHMFPRKIKGRIRFGFHDPYTTGQVLTYISPFYGFYAKNLELIPVFERQLLEGELRLKGRIRIGTLLILGGRIWLDKNFRRVWKKWQQA